MTTVVVVRKDRGIAIAADTMTKWGSGKETADYVVNHGKLLQVGDTWLGLTGNATFKTILRDYFSRPKVRARFDTPLEIFRTWQSLHVALKADYNLIATGHDDEVFFGSGPAALALEEGGHGAAEGGASAGRIVVDEGAVEAVGFDFEEVAPLIPPEGLHFGDGGRVAAAEHEHVGLGGHGLTEVFHQLLDATGASQFFTQGGKRDHASPSWTSPTQARKSKSSATSSICQRPSALRRKEPTHF